MRARTDRQHTVLARTGQQIAVHELQGDQDFVTVEHLIRAVRTDLGGTSWLILDFRRVGQINAAARTLLHRLVRLLADRKVFVVFADPRNLPSLAELARIESAAVRRFPDLDSALEWCEGCLLAREGVNVSVADSPFPLRSQELLRDLPLESLTVVEGLVTTKVLTPGTVVFEEGDLADALYFVAAGQVSVEIFVGRPRRKARINTVAAGHAFGELALVDRGVRSSRIVADEPTVCHVLSVEGFQVLRDKYPEIAASLYQAIARSLAGTLRRATREIRALVD